MKYFFTADQHFGHENIITFTNRPFDSLHEMHSVMTDRWNAKITNEDIVYCLGDFSLASKGKTREYLSRLKGQIKIVPGGHDKWIRQEDRDSGLVIDKLTIIKVAYNGESIPISMCHYPMYSWEKSHYGAPHFHGHSHGNIGTVRDGNDLLHGGMKQGRSIDVGVDCWGFYPMELDELLQIALKE